MPDAQRYQDSTRVYDYTADAAMLGGEIIQLRNGLAAVVSSDIASGGLAGAQTEGIFTVTKSTATNLLDGGRVYWDHSANAATFKAVSDRDFYLGVAVGDAALADTTVKVALNVKPCYYFDTNEDEITTVIVQTATQEAAATTPNVLSLGGRLKMNFGLTAEAQKVDALSKKSFAIGSNAITEHIVNVVTNSDNAAGDINFGLASGTHATDFDAIAECVAVHMDGNALTLNAQSDDGSTAVAAATTTLSATAGTPFEIWIDTRDPANCKVYIDGVRVMDGTTGAAKTFILATGPYFWISHMEKTSDDSPGTWLVWGGVRLAQQ